MSETMNDMSESVNEPGIRLTQYSHGAGCGCKIAPSVLERMLASARPGHSDKRLLVGNETSDDAAVYDLGDGRGLISTTDFFMPIVDDPHSFGRIAATNAISDVYAMGGTPLMAIAILGWPVNQLPAEVAGEVLAGGRAACEAAGIPLAGGHSIDSPEPIFGLAVSGLVELAHLKRNSSASAGCLLYLTKPLGVGILTTALKKGLLKPEHLDLAERTMLQLNKIGALFGTLPYVQALTDVTGFGLLGHLCELAGGSGLSAEIEAARVPRLEGVEAYIAQGALPGGIARNWASYGAKITSANGDELSATVRTLLCDPQTSGGLLAAISADCADSFEALCREHGLELQPFGRLVTQGEHLVTVS